MVGLEFTQLDALMKLNVVDGNGRLAAATAATAAHHVAAATRHVETILASAALVALAIEREFVIDAKLALGHAAQVALHHNFAGHVRAEHLSLRRHEQVDVLEHVEKQLIATVLDALAAPTDLAGHLVGDLRCLFLRLGLDTLLGDVSLEYANIRVLWIAEIEYFYGDKYKGNLLFKLD